MYLTGDTLTHNNVLKQSSKFKLPTQYKVFYLFYRLNMALGFDSLSRQ